MQLASTNGSVLLIGTLTQVWLCAQAHKMICGWREALLPWLSVTTRSMAAGSVELRLNVRLYAPLMPVAAGLITTPGLGCANDIVKVSLGSLIVNG